MSVEKEEREAWNDQEDWEVQEFAQSFMKALNNNPEPIGRKYDTGKLRYDLVDPKWEEAIARALTHGAEKYTKIECFPLNLIESRVRDKVCQEFLNVSYVNELKISFLRECAPLVIEKLRCQGAHAMTVEKAIECLHHEVTVGAVTKNDVLQGVQKSRKVNEGTNLPIETSQRTKNGNVPELENAKKTQSTDGSGERQPTDEISPVMGYPKKIMIDLLNGDAASVAAENDPTWTIIIQLGRLEIYCVVNAIKDLVSFKTIENFLKRLFNISINIADVGRLVSADWNWTQVEDGVNRYYAAARRHIASFRQGEDLDEDSGLRHIELAITNLCMLEYLTRPSAQSKQGR